MKSFIYIALAVIAVALVVLYFTGKKSAHSEVVINAPAQKVWQVLTDTQQYPQWNPTLQLAKGELATGNKVTYQFTQDAENSYEVTATVRAIEPNKLLHQNGGMPLILTYDHRYILQPQGDKTHVTIHEDYRGIGVNFWQPTAVEEAYKRLNEALKIRAEQ